MVADILPKWAGRACVDANEGCLTWRSAPVPGRDPAAGSVAIRYTVLVEKDGNPASGMQSNVWCPRAAAAMMASGSATAPSG